MGDVSLDPHDKRLVQDLVASGRYRGEAEMVRRPAPARGAGPEDRAAEERDSGRDRGGRQFHRGRGARQSRGNARRRRGRPLRAAAAIPGGGTKGPAADRDTSAGKAAAVERRGGLSVAWWTGAGIWHPFPAFSGARVQSSKPGFEASRIAVISSFSVTAAAMWRSCASWRAIATSRPASGETARARLTGFAAAPDIAGVAQHHPPRRIICASSSGFSRIIVGLLTHHPRVIGAADAPAGAARRRQG
jgi:Arc/MetJ-type ribon-helix-helix transcriptional regulator